MKFQPLHFRGFVSHVLQQVDLFSPTAVELELGTCAQESHFGTYRKQIRGPALGVMQVEPTTFLWLQQKYRDRYPELEVRSPEELEWDDRLSVIMCRLRYLADPAPLPAPEDLLGQAQLWKRVYNTFRGKGTVAEYMENYRRFVK